MNALLDESEWRFASVPDDQVFACYHWEFSRTAALESNPKYVIGKSDPSTILGNHLPVQWLPPWPDRAFLNCNIGRSDDEKLDTRGNLAELYQGGIYSRALGSLDLKELNFDLRAYAAKSLAAFVIDWTCTDKHLRDCFEYWLKKNRPDIIKREARGRGAPLAQMKEDLEALGIYRIIKYHHEIPILKLIEKYGDHLAKRFGEEAAWSRAKRRAFERLQSFPGS